MMDESRRQFEECFRAKYKNDPDFEILLEQHNHGTEEDPDFDYYFLVTRNAWYWWQASRQTQPTVAYLSCHGDALTPGDFAGGAEEMHETAKREGWRPLAIKGDE